MNVILFLGAGVSLASGLPTADGLTKLILGTSYHQEGNRRFVRTSPTNTPSSQDDHTPRIRKILKLLQAHDTHDIRRACYYKENGQFKSSGAIFRSQSTYEDLFFLCQQMKLWNIGLVDNSLITPFMECIQAKARDVLAGRSVKARVYDLGLLADLACNYIETIAADSLRANKAVELDLILQLALSPDIKHLDIATLNHDTLAEQVLTEAGVQFVNGFGRPDGDVRWFDDRLFDTNPTKVRILKLHGSVDWYLLLAHDGARPAMVAQADITQLRDASSHAVVPALHGPSFLSGLSKFVSYQRGIYADIHFRFHEALRRSDRMIMSGYGWGDTAINFQLEQWLDQRSSTTLTLLHKTPDKLTDNSLILATGYDCWVRSGRLVPIQKWMSEVSVAELQHSLAFP